MFRAIVIQFKDKALKKPRLKAVWKINYFSQKFSVLETWSFFSILTWQRHLHGAIASLFREHDLAETMTGNHLPFFWENTYFDLAETVTCICLFFRNHLFWPSDNKSMQLPLFLENTYFDLAETMTLIGLSVFREHLFWPGRDSDMLLPLCF